MTDHQQSDVVVYDDEEDEPEDRPKWDLPDIAAVAILLAFYVVVLGGLVAGILYTSNFDQSQIPDSNLTIGTAIQSGSGWASPIMAVVLLSVIAVCWWQSRPQQIEELESEEFEGDEPQLASFDDARAIRSRVIIYFVQVGFLLVTAGAIASLVGQILLVSGISGQTKAYFVTPGANCVAVIVIAGVGLFAGRQVVKRV
jgi:hypothetical protein